MPTRKAAPRTAAWKSRPSPNRPTKRVSPVSSDGSRAESLNARAVLDAWRASGADRVNPLRFHLIDALDRRAAAYD
ncbi:MAG TPA: hypothetical protein DCR74_07495, partial [Achromobacter sp.]|nr:hypothetical protein [Achromobacter sp.]